MKPVGGPGIGGGEPATAVPVSSASGGAGGGAGRGRELSDRPPAKLEGSNGCYGHGSDSGTQNCHM